MRLHLHFSLLTSGQLFLNMGSNWVSSVDGWMKDYHQGENMDTPQRPDDLLYQTFVSRSANARREKVCFNISAVACHISYLSSNVSCGFWASFFAHHVFEQVEEPSFTHLWRYLQS